MEDQIIAHLIEIGQHISQNDDWKQALNQALIPLRKILIFDNMAIYRQDDFGSVEVMYARAVGRGKSAEADAAWGEEVASQVMTKKETILLEPSNASPTANRLARAHLLGLPLFIENRIYGALVFIRFGGPVFEPDQIDLARLALIQFSFAIGHALVSEKTDRLNALERQLRLQEDFVATVSHDLRTPLGFIKGYTTTLLRSDTDWDTATQKEFLTIIDEETDRLAELIENVLESAKLQSETLRMNFQPVRLDALLREVVVRTQTHYRSMRIKLDIEDCPLIQGDSVRLAQIFDNLFSNAMKYAPGAPISVGILNKNDYVLVTFSDHGSGIPKEFLPYIFERFYRVPGRTGGTGTGLGLFICKQIVQAHHGKIWAESEPDKGTHFFIELPVSQQ